MTRTAVKRGPETDAIIAALSAAPILTGDGIRPAGGGFPADDPSQPFVPYAVVFQSITSLIDGPLDDPNADVVAEYQVTSIGVTRASASFIADKAKATLLNTPLTVPGRTVQLVEWVLGRPAERDDDVTPPLFYAIDIYSISTSPA